MSDHRPGVGRQDFAAVCGPLGREIVHRCRDLGRANESAEGQGAQAKQGRRDKPATRLSQAALSGKEPLNSFSQLAALLASRSTEPEKVETPVAAENQESPPSN